MEFKEFVKKMIFKLFVFGSTLRPYLCGGQCASSHIRIDSWACVLVVPEREFGAKVSCCFFIRSVYSGWCSPEEAVRGATLLSSLFPGR